MLLFITMTDAVANDCPKALDFEIKRLGEDKVENLCKYKGNVILVVNTASKCGFTPQYEGLEKLYSDKTLQLNFKSCEMISDDLYAEIIKRYPNRDVEIEVSEDGENGSHAYYHKGE